LRQLLAFFAVKGFSSDDATRTKRAQRSYRESNWKPSSTSS